MLFILLWVATGIIAHWIKAAQFDKQWPGYPSIKTEPMFWIMHVPAALTGPLAFVALLF